MSITIKQLEAFVAIVNMGTFENSANHLHISQSAISKRIQELENATNSVLFDRSKRKTVLTIEGERLYHLSQQALDNTYKIMELGKNSSKNFKPVRVGVTELTSLTWLPAFLNEISENYTEIQLDISIDLSRNLYQSVEDGSLDIIVIPEMLLPSGFSSYLALELEVCFLCRKNYIDETKILKIQDLMKYNFIFQGRQSFYSHKITTWLREQGVSFTKHATVDSLHAMMGLVLAGRGICISPSHYFNSLINSNKIVQLHTNPALPKIHYQVVFKDSPRQALFKELAAHMAKVSDFKTSYFDY